MATTKKAIRFYATPAVEAHLDSLPAQTRTVWINQVLERAINELRPGAKGSELNALAAWLKSQDDAPEFYGAIAEMLDDFNNAN